jgi:lipid-A-disaccharide synthase
MRFTAKTVVERRPDVLVVTTAPASRAASLGGWAAIRRLPLWNVSPSVWAWRPGRARVMRAYIDHIPAPPPFEPEVHRRPGGLPCTHVGHPLAEQVHDLRPDAEEGAAVAKPPVLWCCRKQAREIERLLPVFAEAVALLNDQVGPIEVVIPTVPHLMERPGRRPLDGRQRRGSWSTPRRSRRRSGSRGRLAKSGTVTLELALAGVPTIAAYKVSWLEAVVGRRMIKVPSVILANLVLGENAVPEFLQEACTADNLAAALAPLFGDTEERRRQLDAFTRLDAIMQIGSSAPAARAAEIVLDVARRAKA